jgi:hypothetical protein
MSESHQYERLHSLSQYPVPIYLSPDVEQSAATIAKRYERGYHFLRAELGRSPRVGLLLLSEQDWPSYAALPTYDLTHYDHSQRMVIAGAQRSTFWRPTLELVRTTAPHLFQQLSAIYGGSDEQIDLTAHIDLWVVHDLGHAFHLDADYWFPQHWLMEFFADLCLYTYCAVNEPDQLSNLETLPNVMRQLPAQTFRYATLEAFEAHYGGDMGLDNYLWYHGHFFAWAKHMYEQTGSIALRHMWQRFVVANVQRMPDQQLDHDVPQLGIPEFLVC